VILSPFESDARKWNLFDEIAADHDINQLARSLIPDGGDPDRIWCEFARTFFTAVTKQAIRVDKRDDRELFRLLTSAKPDELRMMLSGTPAGPFLEEGNEKMFGSLRSVASSAVQALEFTTRQQGVPFSIRQWVREGVARHAGGTGGVLFLPYTAGQIAALRSMLSAWLRLAIFEAMDRGEGDQRLWFAIDEVDALGEIDGLKDALARLRKFGGRCILGLQSIGQMSGTYGRSGADTIIENCANTYILRCSASEHGGTSEFASKLIGQREVLHTTVSKTRRFLHGFSSSTASQHLKIEPAVMASEIERLPDLSGFLKLASVPDWQLATLTPRNEPITRPPRPSVAASPSPPNAEPPGTPASPPSSSSAARSPATPSSTPMAPTPPDKSNPVAPLVAASRAKKARPGQARSATPARTRRPKTPSHSLPAP
jgi:type IV secretory pathway TraG/TraD family ATPase VirD4